ncbi:hypothetical protein [Serratia nevei]|uniref:hypothetical protein n=1 Tax=Serratia nevei TaxID=2703794 RepID=UPI00249B137A|nr:hypothetical protein [Serratia nevei]MDI3149347.1 hypothetical protein [Serratia nevei]
MEIIIRRINPYGTIRWREVKLVENGTTIKFDISDGQEFKQFCETLIDSAFGEMEMSEIYQYLKESGYLDEITRRHQEETTEAA